MTVAAMHHGCRSPALPAVPTSARDALIVRFVDRVEIGDFLAVVAGAADTGGSSPLAVRAAPVAGDPASLRVGPLPPGKWVLSVRLFRADGRGDGTTYWAFTVTDVAAVGLNRTTRPRRAGRFVFGWRSGAARPPADQAVGADLPAGAKIETCASSGSITPKTFWRVRRWTQLPSFEVVAGAVPLAGIEADVVGVVVAAERERNAIDRDAIELAGVAIRLLDLADQGAVHLARPSRPHAGRWRPPSGPAPPTGRGGARPSLHPADDGGPTHFGPAVRDFVPGPP